MLQVLVSWTGITLEVVHADGKDEAIYNEFIASYRGGIIHLVYMIEATLSLSLSPTNNTSQKLAWWEAFSKG